MAGWDHWLKIEWSVEPEAGGTRRIEGYITNQYGGRAQPLRMLGQALDSSGAVVGQRIGYVPQGVGGFARAYFEIPDLPAADHYRISVWDYSWLQVGREMP
jgi:hypothetical protein